MYVERQALAPWRKDSRKCFGQFLRRSALGNHSVHPSLLRKLEFPPPSLRPPRPSSCSRILSQSEMDAPETRKKDVAWARARAGGVGRVFLSCRAAVQSAHFWRYGDDDSVVVCAGTSLQRRRTFKGSASWPTRTAYPCVIPRSEIPPALPAAYERTRADGK